MRKSEKEREKESKKKVKERNKEREMFVCVFLCEVIPTHYTFDANPFTYSSVLSTPCQNFERFPFTPVVSIDQGGFRERQRPTRKAKQIHQCLTLCQHWAIDVSSVLWDSFALFSVFILFSFLSFFFFFFFFVRCMISLLSYE